MCWSDDCELVATNGISVVFVTHCATTRCMCKQHLLIFCGRSTEPSSPLA